MLETFAQILGTGIVLILGAVVILAARSWRVEATLKATTGASAISLAAGFSFAGLSASAAAILDGPGVLAVHLRGRELWRRSIEHVSLESALAWLPSLDEQVSKKPVPTKTGAVTRLLVRVGHWLLPRTEMSSLPDLGIRVLAGVRDVSLRGAITCGFSDPALTGKTAAWLFPLAGVLAPVGALEVRLDWSGKTRLDVDVEVSCRVVPARAIFESLRFARHHIHPLRRAPPVVSAVPSSLHT